MKLNRIQKMGLGAFTMCSLILGESIGDANREGVGILWSDSVAPGRSSNRWSIQRAITDQVENQLGQRVIRNSKQSTIPPEILRLAKVRQKVFDLSSELLEMASRPTGSESLSGGSGNQIMQQINRLVGRLPRGTFGPEIQFSRLAEAAWFWKIRNHGLFLRLYGEARNLHPCRQIEFYRFNDEPLTGILESEYQRLTQNKKESTCVLKDMDVSFESSDPTWINGFRVDTRGMEIFSGNYFVLKRDEKGKIFEKIVRCGGKSKHEKAGAWVPLKDQLRIEHVIPSELERTKALLILAEEKGKLSKYHFSSDTGLRLWRPEEGLNPMGTLSQHSFPMNTQEKWYNKSTYWWVAGVVVAASALLAAGRDARPNMAITLKLRNGP
ncbi:hypothetical protein EBT16_03865 [bacterium]|nr:hypothetical protein [bacterium]